MKLLYVPSCHPIQEADDVLMWEYLGIDWFSTGLYSFSNKPGDLPEVKKLHTADLIIEFEQQYRGRFCCDSPESLNSQKTEKFSGYQPQNHIIFTKKFVDRFDAILFNHFPENIAENWQYIQHKPVFIKTYGMHTIQQEHMIKQFREKGVKVIRNSPKEDCRYRNNYAGHDAIIRGSVVKDEDEISGWNGKELKVCTFSSNFNCLDDDQSNSRAFYYETVIDRIGYTSQLYGFNNHRYKKPGPFVSHAEKIEILRNYRVNLCVGTPQSNNTYSFVEAWIMGQPLVAFGQGLWQSDSYEGHELIENGVDGFTSNSLDEIIDFIKQVMTNDKLAQSISVAGRKKAISIYGRKTLAKQWKEFFNANV